MKNFKSWMEKLSDIIPVIWGVLWILIITFVSTGLTIWSVRWLLDLMGVM